MFTHLPKAKRTYGGILADEMGLGKTVMTIGLLHENKAWPVLDEAEERSNLNKTIFFYLILLKRVHEFEKIWHVNNFASVSA